MSGLDELANADQFSAGKSSINEMLSRKTVGAGK